MKLLAGTLVLTLLVTSQARAGNGCAPGTFSITSSPDGRAASVLFDEFAVTGGNGSSGTSSMCNLAVPVRLPPGAIGVYKVDYRGFAVLASGQSSELTVKHALGSDRSVITGPFDGEPVFSNTIGGGQSGTLDSQVLLVLRSAANLDAAMSVIDSIDVAEIGFTTLASVRASVAKLADQRIAVPTYIGTTADVLLGFDQPIDGPSSAGALAARGSNTVGANVRWNFDSGITVLGGVARFKQSAAGVDFGNSKLFAVAIRYVPRGNATWRPFAEVGSWGSPDLAVHFVRHYTNGVATSGTSGSLITGFGRVGVLYGPDPTNEFGLSMALLRNWQHLGGSTEAVGAANLFPATFAASTTSPRVAKVTLSWSSAIVDSIDFTLATSAGRTFGGSTAVHGNIDWVGAVSASPSKITFLEYAARLGWKLTPRTTLAAFVFGTKGSRIGSETQVGGEVRVAF